MTTPATELPPDARAAPRAPIDDLMRLGRLAATFVAPTALLTGLFYYFGWQYAFWYYRTLGVPWTLLGLSTSDYLLRSLDALLTPLLIVLTIALLGLWSYSALRRPVGALLRRWLPARCRRRLGLLPALVGALLTVNGACYWVPWLRNPLNIGICVAPLSLAVGVVLLGTVVGRRQEQDTSRLAALASVVMFFGLTLFWVFGDYSAYWGTARARQLLSSPESTRMVLYSAQSLSLSSAEAGVQETRCQNPEAAYRYRYDGLRLVQQSGNQYLLLPQQWSAGHRVIMLLPKNDSVRLEFLAGPGSSQVPAC